MKQAGTEVREIVQGGLSGVMRVLELPERVAEYYRHSNTDTALFGDCLLRANVHRVELDNLLHGVRHRKREGLSASLHTPFGCITVGRICTTRMIQGNDYTIGACRRECRQARYALRYEGCDFTVYLRGNAQYFYNDRLPGHLESMGIDRIVHNERLFPEGTRER
jgi:hypothetical protein